MIRTQQMNPARRPVQRQQILVQRIKRREPGPEQRQRQHRKRQAAHHSSDVAAIPPSARCGLQVKPVVKPRTSRRQAIWFAAWPSTRK